MSSLAEVKKIARHNKTQTDADLKVYLLVLQLPVDHGGFKQRRKEQERPSGKLSIYASTTLLQRPSCQ